MIKTKKPKLKPSEFINKMFAQYRASYASKLAIDRLKAEYIKNYCPLYVGKEIDLPEETEELYTSFVIEKIDIEINEVPKSDPKAFDIEFKYFGHFIGEFGKGKTAWLKFNKKEDAILSN